jgi:hypothetical protein
MLPEALPYHLKVRDFFRRQTSTWEFFTAARTREEQWISFQTELLKNTSRFSSDSEPALFGKIDRVREQLGFGSLPVMVYQPHLVFTGPIPEKLNEEELLAYIAHELTHVRLYALLDGDMEVADRIVTAIADHQNSAPWLETVRLFKLYTAIYCDRGAYTVLGDPAPVISMLQKLEVGGKHSIRTQALRLWHEQKEGAMASITRMIEGIAGLNRLDLFAQQELSVLTRDFLQEYLRPDWFRTTLVTALERQYFPDTGHEMQDAAGREPEHLREAIAGLPPDIRRYFGYVLLDFAIADPALEDKSAGRAFEFAGEMKLSDIYDGVWKAYTESSKD